MAQVIKRHNKKILYNNHPRNEEACHCRNQNECPLMGSCGKKSLVYQATITSNNNTMKKNYIGMTEGSFKTRFNNHMLSFNRRKYSTKTTLSKYIWELKDNYEDYNIKWSILSHATPYTSGCRACNLCMMEKVFILNADERFLLNKRSELVSKLGMLTNFCTNRPNGYYCIYGDVDLNSLLIGCMLIEPRR